MKIEIGGMYTPKHSTYFWLHPSGEESPESVPVRAGEPVLILSTHEDKFNRWNNDLYVALYNNGLWVVTGGHMRKIL